MGNNNSSDALRGEGQEKLTRESVGDVKSQDHPILASQAKEGDPGLINKDQNDGLTKDAKEKMEPGVHARQEPPESKLKGLENEREKDWDSSENRSETISLQSETQTLTEQDRAFKHEEPTNLSLDREEPAKNDLYGQSEKSDGLINTDNSDIPGKFVLSNSSAEPEKQKDESSVEETKSTEPNSSNFDILDGMGETVTETQDSTIGLKMAQEQLRNEGDEDISENKIKDLEDESTVSVQKGSADNLGRKQAMHIKNGVPEEEEEEPKIVSELTVKSKEERNEEKVSSKTEIKEEDLKKFLEAKTAENQTIQEDAVRQSVESEQEDVNVHDQIRKSPSFGTDLRIEAVKTHVEKKIMMLDRNVSKDSRMEELDGLQKEEEELQGLLEDKKGEKASSKGKEKRRAKGSLLGTCLCCGSVVN